jgi:Sulfatase
MVMQRALVTYRPHKGAMTHEQEPCTVPVPACRLVIFTEDVGVWNIAAYHRGMMGGSAPNIDRIANEGALFTDYYAQQSCTAASTSARPSLTIPSRSNSGSNRLCKPSPRILRSSANNTLRELIPSATELGMTSVAAEAGGTGLEN